MANRRKLILPPVLTVIILLLLAYEQKVGSAQETPSGTSKRVSISAGVASQLRVLRGAEPSTTLRILER